MLRLESESICNIGTQIKVNKFVVSCKYPWLGFEWKSERCIGYAIKASVERHLWLLCFQTRNYTQWFNSSLFNSKKIQRKKTSTSLTLQLLPFLWGKRTNFLVHSHFIKFTVELLVNSSLITFPRYGNCIKKTFQTGNEWKR